MQHTSNRFAFKAIALAATLMATAGTASAQDFVFGWNPRSGDVWVDQRLNDVNQYGSRYREPFIDEMTRYYGAPRDLVSDLIIRQRWAPGDVYYACSIAQVIGRPCRYVADEWNRDHGQGWGVLAQRMGIKPGSAEFHRLKKGFVPTYDRWSRPIVLDRDLQGDFPNRGKGHGKSSGKSNGKSGGMSSGKSNGKSNAHPTSHGSDHGKGMSGASGDHGKPAGNGKPAGHGKGNGKKG